MSSPRPVEPLFAPPDAMVRVPGSKSVTNRALLCAGLAAGESRLRRALVADDTEAMIGCLRALGVSVEVDAGGPEIVVTAGGGVPDGPAELDARQSGTTARFLLPVLAAGRGPYRLDGAPQLQARPMDDGVATARAIGGVVREDGEPGRLPLLIDGGAVGGDVPVAGHVSSQFLSGLLLAGPVLPSGVRVAVSSPLVSAPYVDMTAAIMRRFGAAVDGLRVESGGYQPADIAVEPDATAASYFFAAAAMTGGRVRVEGLRASSVQGDAAFVDVLARMGARVERHRAGTTVTGTGRLRGIEVDLGAMSDTAPTLAVVAAVAEGPTRVTGVGFIRTKESDRVGAVVTELRRCGIAADEEPGGFVVHPGPLQPAVVQTYDDHRMAMSFALLGLVAPGIAIAGPECVAKTFPGYWDALDSLRAV